MRTTARRSQPTACQRRAAAAYLFGSQDGSRRRPTQAEVAKVFGVSQQAVSGRLRRYAESLPEAQRERYLQCLATRRRPRGPRTRVLQLNFADAV